MNDLYNIKESLEKIQFTSYNQYASELLEAFKIPNTTIRKLLSNAENSSFKDPINIYRRATIIYDETLKCINDITTIEKKLSSVFRLLIVISNDLIVCKDFITEEVIGFKPNLIHNYINFFFPLIYGKAFEKDLFTTVDFSELVGRLFNQLCMEEQNAYSENPDIISNFVLSLIYLSFGKSILKDKEIEKVINWTTASQHTNYTQIIEGILNAVFNNEKRSVLFGNLPNIGISLQTQKPLPHINVKCFELSAKIICYDLTNIDTEILGSLIYKLVKNDDVPDIYGHYTSYQNVAKVLNPLFINKYERLIETNQTNFKYLKELRSEIRELTFFDPTNGPGCFLSSSFSSVVNLVSSIDNILGSNDLNKISINHFVGLVENDLSLKLSQLSLWVSYLQYLQRYYQVHESDLQKVYKCITIYRGDQLLTEWGKICPNNGKIFIIGSPTFKGAKKIDNRERRKMRQVFGTSKLGDSDYCSCWLYLAAKYIGETTSQCALVLTNSVCQGSQVSFIWNRIFNISCEISFAHRSFKWRNNAQRPTGVTVVIIGLASSKHGIENKYLYTGNLTIKTFCIGPYLINSTKTIVEKRKNPLSSQLPRMPKGNMPYDNNILLLLNEERNTLLKNFPSAKKFLKRIVGSDEFINKIDRWCLWIPTENLDEALSIPSIAERIERVKQYRLSKSDLSARRLAMRSHQFREFRSTTTQTLVIPSVSSENRPYIPIGFIGSDTIVSNLAFTIYDCDPWIFGLISSKMHMVWVRTVCGSLETRIRYSSRLGYNTFPFPLISNDQKNHITSLVFDIISERAKYCDLTLGEIYSDLPESLKIFHKYLDDYIDFCFQNEPFNSDMDRVKLLFQLYEKKIKAI